MKGRLVIAFAAVLLSLAHRTAVAGKVTYIHTDIQGTPVMESDAQGHITARYDYTPYGVTVQSLGGSPNGPGYTGHVNDPDTGFVYMQARYYDSSMGRFLEVDQLSPSPGNLNNFSRYAYVDNNPLSSSDPTGMFPKHMSGSDIECEIYVHSNCGAGANGDKQSPINPIPVTHAQNTSVPITGYSTPMLAGQAGEKVAGGLSDGQIEYAGVVLTKTGRYWYTFPVTINESRGVMVTYNPPSDGYSWAGVMFHSHPPGGPRTMVFSPTDVSNAQALHWISIIGFHENGSMKFFDPNIMHVGLRNGDRYSIGGLEARHSAEGEELCENCFP